MEWITYHLKSRMAPDPDWIQNIILLTPTAGSAQIDRQNF